MGTDTAHTPGEGAQGLQGWRRGNAHPPLPPIFKERHRQRPFSRFHEIPSDLHCNGPAFTPKANGGREEGFSRERTFRWRGREARPALLGADASSGAGRALFVVLKRRRSLRVLTGRVPGAAALLGMPAVPLSAASAPSRTPSFDTHTCTRSHRDPEKRHLSKPICRQGAGGLAAEGPCSFAVISCA